VADVVKESVWFIIIYCFFTVGSVKFLQFIFFVIIVGEEVTVFEFVRGNKKNFENHWLNPRQAVEFCKATRSDTYNCRLYFWYGGKFRTILA